MATVGFTTVNSNEGLLLQGNANNGASAVGCVINNAVTFSTSGAKLLSVCNNGTEKASIDYAGNAVISGQITANATLFNNADVSQVLDIGGGGGDLYGGNLDSSADISIRGNGADGASAVAVAVNSLNSFATAGAKLLSTRNNTVEKAYVGFNGGYSLGLSTASGNVALSMPSNTYISFSGGALDSVASSGSGASLGYNSGISSLETATNLVLSAGFFHAANGISPDSGGHTWGSTGNIAVRSFTSMFNPQSGTPYDATTSHSVIGMSDDAVRSVVLPGAAPAGQTFTVIDTSGSVTAGHTLTVSAASGSVKSGGTATAVITPGVSGSLTVVSDGTNYWITAKV